ncbi:protein translocase subunit SecE [Tepiditoga spiralis]|uniref:Protein translocase subunit SecE n=1 Tax=Tepiditoga spiralis TaxID=2108365 RepID=A0A7G1GAG5_9BACT|nr:preprotein translocase subunit SecE [Tepiditoga spiralis]BBE32127.1 protein translocase subunit SecE [Tepiditoga spiralis]
MSKFWVFLSSVMQEARKVNWPSRKELLNSTAVVLVIIVFIALYLMLVDFGMLNFFQKLVYPLLLGGASATLPPGK